MAGKQKGLLETDHMLRSSQTDKKNPPNTEGRGVSVYFHRRTDGLQSEYKSTFFLSQVNYLISILQPLQNIPL